MCWNSKRLVWRKWRNSFQICAGSRIICGVGKVKEFLSFRAGYRIVWCGESEGVPRRIVCGVEKVKEVLSCSAESGKSGVGVCRGWGRDSVMQCWKGT